MRKYLSACACAVLALAGLALPQNTGKPVIGAWGFDTAAMDQTIRPGDDFFRYANGAWIDRAVIPPDKFAATRRLEMTDRTESRLHDILEAAATGVAHEPRELTGKIGAFYRAFMDERRVDRLAARPIAKELAAVRSCRSRGALAALTGRSNADFESGLFSISIDVDLKDPSRYAVYINQAGLGLPDRDYYLDDRFADKKSAYQGYVARLLMLINWPNARERAQEVVDFETKIARASWTRAQDRDLNATYNPVPRSGLPKLAPQFDWEAFLAAANVDSMPTFIAAENTAFPKMAAVFAQTPLDALKAWQAFHVADNAAPYLSNAFADAWFEMHDRALSGQAEQRVRWKRAITAVSGGDFGVGDRFGTFGTMGWGVGQLYTAKYFPPAAKANVEELVRNLVASYRARLETLDWMGPTTRAEAIKKLQTYTIKIGYPDHPRDYSSLIVTDDDLTGDVRRAAALDWAFYVGRLGGAVDRSDWIMTPQTNDAYNGSLRDIVFPAGILQPPIFDANADAAINYGAVGGVIGHELTHGFDDQGRKIDASGALKDWWTADDAAKFEARAAVLEKQYSSYRPLPGEPSVHVNGELTLGENIADLGGLTLALDAYQASLRGTPPPTIGGFTGTQRVFLGWAQAWCGKTTSDYVRKQLVSDPHSPRQFRVNGIVRNIDTWYPAFALTSAEKLYLAPQDRVHIW